jgi:hypothetical protein
MSIDVSTCTLKSCIVYKHVWCSMMNTCLCEHVSDDVFNQFLSMCLIIIA